MVGTRVRDQAEQAGIAKTTPAAGGWKRHLAVPRNVGAQ